MSTTGLLAVGEAAQALRDRVSPTELGRLVERPCSTITRREALEVLDWPARDVLRLARADDRLGQAVVDYLLDRPRPLGDGRQIGADLAAEITSAGLVHSVAMHALADGRLNARELDDICAAVEVERRNLDTLARDCAAAQQAYRR
jgi:hypothetical protein